MPEHLSHLTPSTRTPIPVINRNPLPNKLLLNPHHHIHQAPHAHTINHTSSINRIILASPQPTQQPIPTPHITTTTRKTHQLPHITTTRNTHTTPTNTTQPTTHKTNTHHTQQHHTHRSQKESYQSP